MDKKTVFSHVDHTQLKATAVWADIKTLCEEALHYGMATVCIPPSFVKPARESFKELKICTVVGFPLGYSTAESKLHETTQALSEGADEIDMVINIGDAKAGRFERITGEIRTLKAACKDKVLKVIVETCYLDEAEKIALCRCVSEGGADYIKTSTGFGTAGATLEDVALFKQHIAPHVKIKAAGGIRKAEDMIAFLEAGCDRIGASGAIKAFAGEDVEKHGY